MIMIGLLLATFGIWGTSKLVMRFLQFFQQEEYHMVRFLRWWIKSRSWEPKSACISTLMFVTTVVLTMVSADLAWLTIGMGGLALLGVALQMALPVSKKPLRITARIKRLLIVTSVLQGVPLILVGALDQELFSAGGAILAALALMLVVQLVPLFIVLANLLLTPLEGAIQRFYLGQARRCLADINPCIVAITGSYGKTSTKHFVAQVLRGKTPTHMTSGSINTLMGITREIRENLKPEHRYFVVEMGAYGIGSIRRLCGLTPPKISIITWIGKAHLERFGSVENIARAKGEIAEALPPDGWLIFNSDNQHCRDIAQRLHCRTISFGRQAQPVTPDLLIKNVVQQGHGLDITFEFQGVSYLLHAPVHGEHHASNLIAAIAVAICTDIPIPKAIASLGHAAPIQHRCVVTQSNGVTWIDDSYNSNPLGFQHALEVLHTLPGKRSILVTPGMVELGDEHDNEHRRLAQVIARTCSEVCLVAPKRIESLRAALSDTGYEQSKIHCFENFAEARNWLLQHLEAGDKVLLENDLPDLHEQAAAFSSTK